jgi:hypothetical protein
MPSSPGRPFAGQGFRGLGLPSAPAFPRFKRGAALVSCSYPISEIAGEVRQIYQGVKLEVPPGRADAIGGDTEKVPHRADNRGLEPRRYTLDDPMQRCRYGRFVLEAVLLLATTASASMPLPSVYNDVAVQRPGPAFVFKPHKYSFTADGNGTLLDVHWETWNRSQAFGTPCRSSTTTPVTSSEPERRVDVTLSSSVMYCAGTVQGPDWLPTHLGLNGFGDSHPLRIIAVTF